MNHQCYYAVGRLTRPPKLFPVGRRGQEHATFTLAINRVVPNEEGPGTDYINCVIWGPEARNLFNKSTTGDELQIRAKLRTSYVAKGDGDSEYRLEIRVDRIQYGAVALSNMAGPPKQDDTTIAVGSLSKGLGE